LRDNQLVVIDQLSFAAPKTKDMAAILTALKCTGDSLLVATAAHDENVYRSARNIADVTVAPVEGLNALNVLQPTKLLVTRAALDSLKKRAAEAQADKA
jgi:large subunit ribosomal protein L4